MIPTASVVFYDRNVLKLLAHCLQVVVELDSGIHDTLQNLLRKMMVLQLLRFKVAHGLATFLENAAHEIHVAHHEVIVENCESGQPIKAVVL